MQKTNISWCTHTWNPCIGCPLPLASIGCANCYARKLHNTRHKAYKAGKKLPKQYAKPFEEIQLFPDRLEDPLHKKKPCRIFVGSMTDLLAEQVPFEFIDKVWWTMSVSRQHCFQVLTKRPERYLEYWQYRLKKGFTDGTRENIWAGVSISTQKEADEKIPILLQIPAAKRFISLEPLLEKIDLSDVLDNAFISGIRDLINQLIIGAESINGKPGRECKLEWIRDVVQQCKAAGVKVFVKQIPLNGKLVRNIEEFPEDLQIQELI